MPFEAPIVITNDPITITTEHRLDVQEHGSRYYRYVFPLDGQITSVEIDGQKYEVREKSLILIHYEASL